MALLLVLVQLIPPVVLLATMCALMGLDLEMAATVISRVTERCELLTTDIAAERLLPSMHALVHVHIALLGEEFAAARHRAAVLRWSWLLSRVRSVLF
jgi:hypothetical protein